MDQIFGENSNRVTNCGISDERPKNPFIFKARLNRGPKDYGITTLWFNLSGRLTLNAQLVHNAKEVFHDLVDTAHGGLRLGNRCLDIEQYNGLRKPPTAQEEIDGFPDQGEDVMEPSMLEITEQEMHPSISGIFDTATHREKPYGEPKTRTPTPTSPERKPDSPGSIIARTPSPISPTKKSDSVGSIVEQINQLHISPTEPTMSTSTIAFTGTTPGDTGCIVWTPRGRRIRKSRAKPVVEVQ